MNLEALKLLRERRSCRSYKNEQIADAGLDSEGRRLARLLADREPGVLLCPLAALPDRLTEG